MQHQIGVEREVHEVDAGEPQLPGLASVRHPRLDGGGVDCLRIFALQAEDHRLVRPVTATGGAERTIELRLNAGGGIQITGLRQRLDEPTRRAHRSDRVR